MMRRNLLKVLNLVRNHEPLWKGADEVKKAGLHPNTFRDAAEELVHHGALKRNKYLEGSVGRPRVYYEIKR